jgi:hypothetical protein
VSGPAELELDPDGPLHADADVSGDAASAFGDFEAAIRHNADDPDIYYHRGQGELAASSSSL